MAQQAFHLAAAGRQQIRRDRPVIGLEAVAGAVGLDAVVFGDRAAL